MVQQGSGNVYAVTLKPPQARGEQPHAPEADLKPPLAWTRLQARKATSADCAVRDPIEQGPISRRHHIVRDLRAQNWTAMVPPNQSSPNLPSRLS
jgi:hypothetical protein